MPKAKPEEWAALESDSACLEVMCASDTIVPIYIIFSDSEPLQDHVRLK